MGWSCSDHYTVLDAAARFKPRMIIDLDDYCDCCVSFLAPCYGVNGPAGHK